MVGGHLPTHPKPHGHPEIGLWVTSPHVTSFADKLCFNSSDVVVANPSLSFNVEGE